ncbi:MAG: hypothetical protein WCD76_21085, partial [Pyrinomonadaceae bacterium]
MTRHRLFIIALCILSLPATHIARQAPAVKTGKPAAKKTSKGTAAAAAIEVDPMIEVRRTTAISLVNSLADEARNFRDPVLRARVQARSADALWETDTERARALFRRSWEAAESADAEGERRVEEERKRQTAERGNFSVQLPPSLRTEVLRLAARRDRTLGEEFLAQMEERRKDDAASSATNADKEAATKSNDPALRPDPLEGSPGVAKRLELARQLL